MAPRHIMIVAGEASGDLLGAGLMRALKQQAGEELRITGVGGEEMTAEGLSSLFPMSTLSVMGVFEILPQLRPILRCMKMVEEFVRREKPDVLVTIDSPGFNHRVAKRLKEVPVRKIHYVAPSVWAYRPGRAKEVAHLYDGLLTLLPFEPPYFEAHGLQSEFVGHPATTAENAYAGLPSDWRDIQGIAPDKTLLAVLFGSRRGEVKRLGPIYVQALKVLADRHPDLHVISPTLPHVRDRVEELLTVSGVSHTVLAQADKQHAFHAADLALATSGTVALELGLAKVPAVIAYRMNALTVMIARMLVRVKWANLINILNDRGIVPELIQEDCSAENIVSELEKLLVGSDDRAAQVAAGAAAMEMLTPEDATPSERAARFVLEQGN